MSTKENTKSHELLEDILTEMKDPVIEARQTRLSKYLSDLRRKVKWKSWNRIYRLVKRRDEDYYWVCNRSKKQEKIWRDIVKKNISLLQQPKPTIV